ncbi:MAG TPA: hypothetical protein VGP72_16830 [Planctomycetota bacterium]|jgi:hypothetical protein
MKGKQGKKLAQGGQQGGAKRNQGGQDNQDGDKGQKQGKPGNGLGGGPGMGARPYRDIADPGFKGEHLKGDMQNGAITSLSHFRGQGAKSDAPAEFVKYLDSVEKDPASSLELERVPRDARDVVQDYFLNVKKGAGIQPPPPVAPPQAPQPKAEPAPKAPAGPAKEALKE